MRPVIAGALFGYVFLRQGDCGLGGGGCSSSPVSRTIFVREPTLPWAAARPHLVATGGSDPDGYYEIDLRPGRYSVFVDDDGTESCNWAENETLCPVEIIDRPVLLDLVIDHAAY